jgi:hypothetical protein
VEGEPTQKHTDVTHRASLLVIGALYGLSPSLTGLSALSVAVYPALITLLLLNQSTTDTSAQPAINGVLWALVFLALGRKQTLTKTITILVLAAIAQYLILYVIYPQLRP